MAAKDPKAAKEEGTREFKVKKPLINHLDITSGTSGEESAAQVSLITTVVSSPIKLARDIVIISQDSSMSARTYDHSFSAPVSPKVGSVGSDPPSSGVTEHALRGCLVGICARDWYLGDDALALQESAVASATSPVSNANLFVDSVLNKNVDRFQARETRLEKVVPPPPGFPSLPAGFIGPRIDPMSTLASNVAPFSTEVATPSNIGDMLKIINNFIANNTGSAVGPLVTITSSPAPSLLSPSLSA